MSRSRALLALLVFVGVGGGLLAALVLPGGAVASPCARFRGQKATSCRLAFRTAREFSRATIPTGSVRLETEPHGDGGFLKPMFSGTLYGTPVSHAWYQVTGSPGEFFSSLREHKFEGNVGDWGTRAPRMGVTITLQSGWFYSDVQINAARLPDGKTVVLLDSKITQRCWPPGYRGLVGACTGELWSHST